MAAKKAPQSSRQILSDLSKKAFEANQKTQSTQLTWAGAPRYVRTTSPRKILDSVAKQIQQTLKKP